MNKVYSHNSEISQQNKETRSNNQYENLNSRKRVDINILLNRIKLNNKNKYKEKIILLSIVILCVGVMGVLISFGSY